MAADGQSPALLNQLDTVPDNSGILMGDPDGGSQCDAFDGHGMGTRGHAVLLPGTIIQLLL